MTQESDHLFLGAAARAPSPASHWGQLLEQQGARQAAAGAKGPFGVAMRTPDGGAFLAVDRFAQETLCWAREGNDIRYAARADAFGARALDPQAVYDYLFFHVVPSPRTIFRGVQRLPAGHFAVHADGRTTVEPYARHRFSPAAAPSFDALKAEFRRLLRESVEAELDRTVPACFLSGGTDSSTVAGLIKQAAGRVHTYSIGFDAAGYDEMEFARIAARHFGADHHEYYVTPDDLVRSIGHVSAAFDQPFGNSSVLPAYHCALRAREDGVSKLLAGDGGDELFGGNSRYVTQKLYAAWDKVPAIVRNGMVKPLLSLPGAGRMPVLRRGRNYVRDAELGLPDRLHHYNPLLRLGIENVLTPAFRGAIRPESVFEQQRDVWRLAEAESDLDLQLAFDWRYTLAESDLPKVRGSTALAGVAVGFPFLNDALVEFSMQLPETYKVKGKQLRWFFKEALRDFLPDAIITKQKKGFGLPFGVWATQHAGLKALATDSLLGFGQRGVVRPEFLKSLLDDLLPSHPGYYGEVVWIMMMFEQWLRHHAPDWRLADSA